MSKESIIRELPDDFVRQMRNWATTGSNVGMYTISPAYEGMPSSRVPGSVILANYGEISHVERAIDALQNRERLAVRLFWMYEGQDLVWLGRRLGCDYRVVESRVRRGHERMRQDLAILEAAYERQRDRRLAYA